MGDRPNHDSPGQLPAVGRVGGPASGPVPLVDSFGRVHRDLRISITDRCNFRCTYCMPEEGMPWLPRTDLLSYEELTRVAALLVERTTSTASASPGVSRPCGPTCPC